MQRASFRVESEDHSTGNRVLNQALPRQVSPIHEFSRIGFFVTQAVLDRIKTAGASAEVSVDRNMFVPSFRCMSHFLGGRYFMNSQAILPGITEDRHSNYSSLSGQRRGKKSSAAIPFRFTSYDLEDGPAHRQAELFYLQKQIQAQTPMVIVLEDGERLEGCIEWYDRGALKIRGRSKTLIYKSAIKYMYKLGETGQ
jgi:sRNA-binding regulator protein Hfq